MKKKTKDYIHRILMLVFWGSAAFALESNVYADVTDAEAELSPPYVLASSEDCAYQRYSDQISTNTCVPSSKLALNNGATAVDWKYAAANPFSYNLNDGESNSAITPKALHANGALIASSSQPDISAITEVTTVAPSASLILEDGIGSDAETGSDNVISEPLLTSILALIAIVAVARRNVSGI